MSAGSAEQWRCDSLGPEQSDWGHWLWSLKCCLEAAFETLSKFLSAVSQIGSGFLSCLNSEFHKSESVSWAVQSPLKAEKVHGNVSGLGANVQWTNDVVYLKMWGHFDEGRCQAPSADVLHVWVFTLLDPLSYEHPTKMVKTLVLSFSSCGNMVTAGIVSLLWEWSRIL